MGRGDGGYEVLKSTLGTGTVLALSAAYHALIEVRGYMYAIPQLFSSHIDQKLAQRALLVFGLGQDVETGVWKAMSISNSGPANASSFRLSPTETVGVLDQNQPAEITPWISVELISGAVPNDNGKRIFRRVASDHTRGGENAIEVQPANAKLLRMLWMNANKWISKTTGIGKSQVSELRGILSKLKPEGEFVAKAIKSRKRGNEFSLELEKARIKFNDGTR